VTGTIKIKKLPGEKILHAAWCVIKDSRFAIIFHRNWNIMKGFIRGREFLTKEKAVVTTGMRINVLNGPPKESKELQ
jgi:hypothetical protein